MYPSNGQQPQHWWQSMGQLGKSVGQIGGDAIATHRANKALQQDQPLQDAVGQAVDGTPMPSAGPAPTVGAYSGGDDYGEPMAEGKIVTKPTLALIGERQPEAVVPLAHRTGAKVRPGMAMPGRRYYGE